MKNDFKVERESFEEALTNAEEWHKKSLAENLAVRDRRIAIKDKRIAELEALLKDKEIERLDQRLNELENKFEERNSISKVEEDLGSK